MNYKDARGFTLIELIAVLGLLTLIIMISVPLVDRVMGDAESNIDEVQVAMIEGAASMASEVADLGDTVSVRQLIERGYLEADKLDDSPLKNAVLTVQDDGYHKLQVGTNENLIMESHTPRSSSVYLVTRYKLIEPWEVGETYTVQIKGNVNSGNKFGLWRDNGGRILTYLDYDASTGIWTGTAVARETTRSDDDGITASIYNYVNTNAKSANIEWIKVERGDQATPYVKAIEK